jgi:hypothetical protein
MARYVLVTGGALLAVVVVLVALSNSAHAGPHGRFMMDGEQGATCPPCRTCPECPKTSWYRWLNDNLNQHPWMQVFYWSACAVVRMFGGTPGTYAVDYVIHPSWHAMRAWEWYNVISRFAFDFTLTVVLMLVYMCGGFLPVLVWARQYVRWIPAPAPSHVNTAAAVAYEPPPCTCQALVASTGKPCTKAGTSHRDGRRVCGVHAKSRQLTYQG